MTRMESLDVFLRRGPGRCVRCGNHPATQGHTPDCDRKGKR